MNDKNYLSLFSVIVLIMIGGFVFGGLIYNSDLSTSNKAEIIDAVLVDISQQSSTEDVVVLDDTSNQEVSLTDSNDIGNIDQTKIVDIETIDDIDATDQSTEDVVFVQSDTTDNTDVVTTETIDTNTQVQNVSSKSRYIKLFDNIVDSIDSSTSSSIKNVSIFQVGGDFFLGFITTLPSRVNIRTSNSESGENSISELSPGYKLNHLIKINTSNFSIDTPNTISIFATSPKCIDTFISTFSLN